MLPTVEQIKQAMDDVDTLCRRVDAMTEKVAATAWDIRTALRDVYTTFEPIGVYVDPQVKSAAIHWMRGMGNLTDTVLVKTAVARVLPVVDEPLDDAVAASGDWIKVAYSPTLRRAGEWLNFFPSAGTDIVPNSPLASMLTSGLVGAGLGYGGGWLASQFTGDDWRKKRLRRNMAIAGGLAGMTPGLLWGAANKASGRTFNDPSLLDHSAPDAPSTGPTLQNPGEYGPGLDYFSGKMGCDLSEDLPFKVGKAYCRACEKLATDWGSADAELVKEAFGAGAIGLLPRQEDAPTTLDVNVNHLGQTLWEIGADPQTASMTMGALHAAQQMPGGKGSEWVTPTQMGRLAAGMGAGYLSGALVGGTLGALTGLPQGAQDTLKRTGMYLGIVKSVVPRLFGG